MLTTTAKLKKLASAIRHLEKAEKSFRAGGFCAIAKAIKDDLMEAALTEQEFQVEEAAKMNAILARYRGP